MPSAGFELSPVITAGVYAWIGSQAVKITVGLVKYGRSDIDRLRWRFFWAGGMPSSHSALVTAISLTIVWSEGISSSLAGLALTLALLTVYDRLRANYIYRLLQKAVPAFAAEVAEDPSLKDLAGHTSYEVGIGCLIGGAASAVTYFW